MSNLLTTLDEIESLQDKSIFLYIDMENIPCLILKDTKITNIFKSQIFYYYTDEKIYFVVKNLNELYIATISKNELKDDVVDFINAHCFMNIVFLSNDSSIHPINRTPMKALISNDILLDTNNKNEIHSYINKMEDI